MAAPAGLRARGAFVLRLSVDPPWAMRIQDEAPLIVICQTEGRAVILGDDGCQDWLNPGDVALARGTRHYVFADSPSTRAGHHPSGSTVHHAGRRRPAHREDAWRAHLG